MMKSANRWMVAATVLATVCSLSQVVVAQQKRGSQEARKESEVAQEAPGDPLPQADVAAPVFKPSVPTNASAVPEPENLEQARRLLAEQAKAIRTLSESLELAASESDFFRREWRDIKLRDEALGVDALTGDEKRLQLKLVNAVRDLYQSEQQRKEAIAQLSVMTELVTQLLRKPGARDPEFRADVEAQLRVARELVAGKTVKDLPSASDLKSGTVLKFNPELSLAVLNFGTAQQARIGMNVEITRGGSRVALCRVVDVRQQLCGAVVEWLEKNQVITEGDNASVMTR